MTSLLLRAGERGARARERGALFYILYSYAVQSMPFAVYIYIYIYNIYILLPMLHVCMWRDLFLAMWSASPLLTTHTHARHEASTTPPRRALMLHLYYKNGAAARALALALAATRWWRPVVSNPRSLPLLGAGERASTLLGDDAHQEEQRARLADRLLVRILCSQYAASCFA